MVLLSHLLIIERKYSQDTILPSALSFGITGVDIFFVISGFIMVYVTHKWSHSAARHIPEFLFARAGRIYPLYWIISLAVLVVFLVRPGLVFSSSVGNEPNIIKSFLLWPDRAYPLLEIGWTLIHEMGFYLIFAGLLVFARKHRPLLICIWGAIVIAGYAMGAHTHGPVMAILFHPLSLEFCGGALLAYGLLKWTPKHNDGHGWPPFILSLLLFIIFVFIFTTRGESNPGFGWLRIITFGLSALCLLLAAFLFEQKGKTAPRWSVILGDWSYALYLTHILTLSLMGRLWAIFDQPELWDNLLVLPLMIIGSLIVAGLTHKIIEAPMMRASKALQKKLF